MVKGKIDCGICGHQVEVLAEAQKRGEVKLEIKSNCANYQKLSGSLQQADAFKELFSPLGQGEAFQLFAKTIPHPSCPGLAGILKTIEVAAGLALPQKASIEIEKIDKTSQS